MVFPNWGACYLVTQRASFSFLQENYLLDVRLNRNASLSGTPWPYIGKLYEYFSVDWKPPMHGPSFILNSYMIEPCLLLPSHFYWSSLSLNCFVVPLWYNLKDPTISLLIMFFRYTFSSFYSAHLESSRKSVVTLLNSLMGDTLGLAFSFNDNCLLRSKTYVSND